MNKIFKKDNIMPVIVLTVICLVIAAILGVANMVTEERIEKNEADKVYGSLKVVIDGNFEPVDLPSTAPKSVNNLYKVTDDNGDLKGHAVTLSVQGYASVISLTVGVDAEGKVTKAVVTSQAESHGKAGMANYTDNFTGVSKDDLPSVDKFSGATVSSTAIKNAIIDAVNVAMGVEPEEEKLPREDSELIELAKTLVGNEVTLTDVTPEETEYAKRIYKAGSEGYVAYTLVMSRYGYPETETLVYVGNNGAIKAVNKLVWKTSDPNPEYGYYPPEEDAVNVFYDNLIGKTANDLEAYKKTETESDFVSNATSTSTALRDALVEALKEVELLISKDMPTPEDEIIALSLALVGKDVELKNVTPEKMTYVKRIYKADREGYVAYVVVMSRYGYPETETLVHIGNDGKIKNVNKLVWKTSDAMYGYVPPTEDIVNVFYENLIGKKASELEAYKKTETESDFVSNATNTSTNLRDALVEALKEVEALIFEDMPTDEADIKNYAKALIGKEVDFEDVTPKNLNYVRRIYSVGKEGYIVYAVVISANYGTVETETLIHVGKDGIIKGVKKLVWKTSDAIYGYVPPTAETVDAFYGKLVGQNASTISDFKDADLVSNATNTSTNLKNSIVEGLEAVEEIQASMPNYTARIVGIVLAVLVVLGVAAYNVVPVIIRRRKNR